MSRSATRSRVAGDKDDKPLQSERGGATTCDGCAVTYPLLSLLLQSALHLLGLSHGSCGSGLKLSLSLLLLRLSPPRLLLQPHPLSLRLHTKESATTRAAMTRPHVVAGGQRRGRQGTHRGDGFIAAMTRTARAARCASSNACCFRCCSRDSRRRRWQTRHITAVLTTAQSRRDAT
jgi:hypothetical protein